MRVAFVSVVFLFCSSALSQRFNFVNYSLEEGLPQSQVSDICQDRWGYLWIGTETGLSRFDGIRFENFSTDNGLPDNEIDKIFLDKDGKIWVATPKGIARYSYNGFEAFPFSDSLSLEFRVNDLCEMNEQIYLATDEGLLLFASDSFQLVTRGIEEAGSMRALANVGDTLLVCGSRNGLFKYSSAGFRSYNHPALDTLNISDVYLQGREMLVSTYGNGLFIINLESGKTEVKELPINRIRAIYANSESILCATKNGAIEITQDGIYHYTLSNGLIFENIRSVYIDREENLWLGSDGKGLMKLTGKSVISYTRSDGLSSDAVMSITQDSAGFYYFGTYDAGVTKWHEDGDSSKAVIYNDELKNSTVWITEMENGFRCWIGSSDGIDLIENGKVVTSQQMAQLTDSRIKTFLFIHDSLRFFGGAAGVTMLSGSEVRPLYADHNLDVNKLIFSDGYLYIATTTGLIQSNPDGTQMKLIPLPENNVKSIATDREGNLWIGTNSSGIFVQKKDGGLFPFELDKDDTRSKTILGLITATSGDVWVATLNGVYQVILVEDANNQYTINHYGRAEGLITLECNQNAIFEDHDHNIWVGTSEGLVRINPALNSDLFRFKRPELMITGVRLFMEKFDYSNYNVVSDKETGVPVSITLPYNKNHLTFDFIGINLKDPEGVRYEYRLRGAEDSWSPLTENSYATYSFIAHGEYDFEVRAINASGEWSETSRMHIIILPPFWLTWWFIGLMVLFGIALIIILFRIRIRAITQRQENERLGLKNRLLFLEQQSLNASMNRHFIFNSLNSIQYFINSSNKLAANKYLTSFAKLIRKNLDSSQANNFIVTLKEEIERIELYLSLEKMRFEGKFEYVVKIDEDIDADSIEIPSMILQPFVENSIIHGVLPIERKGLIQLKIYLEFGFLVFEVVDDGIGIDSSLALKKNKRTEESHDSMGMEITNRRIELLHKLTGENLMIIGPFQVNNQQGESLGTKVIIKVNVENQQNS
ncbi:MAG: histidine kinase [Bacteroidetes bacterium]|nr:histidine kinase [Bacteroidota bacterium]